MENFQNVHFSVFRIFLHFGFPERPSQATRGPKLAKYRPQKNDSKWAGIKFFETIFGLIFGPFWVHLWPLFCPYFATFRPIFDPFWANFSSVFAHFRFFSAGFKCFRLDLIHFRLELNFLWLELIENFSKKVGHFFRREGAADPR